MTRETITYRTKVRVDIEVAYMGIRTVTVGRTGRSLPAQRIGQWR